MARRTAAAEPLAPMLASVASEVPEGKGWIFEPKYDGIRVIGVAHDGGAALFSRNGLEKTRQFPEIAEALARAAKTLKRGLIVDGEIVAIDESGEPSRFQDLQGRMHVTNEHTIARSRTESPAALVLFDLLMEGDTPLVNEPWTTRRERLEALFGKSTGALRLGGAGANGTRMLAEARSKGWEGIMAKRADALYRPGVRTKDWVKLKIERRQEFVVGGYTEPRNSRSHFGAILLGYYTADGDLVYAGHTGGGFSRETLADMYRRLEPLEIARSPFTTTPKTNERAHWVKPEVVVEVKFNEWTQGGHLRQPIFVGVRDDKNPTDVVREPEGMTKQGKKGRKTAAAGKTSTGRKTAAARKTSTGRKTAARTTSTGRKTAVRRSMPGKTGDVLAQLDAIEAGGGKGTLQLDTGSLDVTNLGKVFFPGSSHTKGDLLRYYATMAPYILPSIADRPLVLKRFPNGINGKAFYQQKAPDDAPASVRIEEVADEGITTQRRIIGGDVATLLYIAQLGAVSVDPWHSRVQTIEHADYSIIDLDPGPKASFERVIQVACWVKDVLDELGLHAVPKTSGASGIHIVLPLGPRVPNDSARMVAEVVATAVADRHPREATIVRAVRERPAATVYVDFLQNIRGKTVAGVYSVRANEGAPVSTPLKWEEIASGLKPTDFTIDNVPARVAKVGELWARGMKKPNDLDALGRKRGRGGRGK